MPKIFGPTTCQESSSPMSWILWLGNRFLSTASSSLSIFSSGCLRLHFETQPPILMEKNILFEGSQRLENCNFAHEMHQHSKHSASQKVVVPAAVRKPLKFCVENSRGFALHFSVVSTLSRLRSAAWKRFCCLAVCSFTHQFVCPKTSSSYSCFMIWVCLKMECPYINWNIIVFPTKNGVYGIPCFQTHPVYWLIIGWTSPHPLVVTEFDLPSDVAGLMAA